jgi:hypothetical protein
MCIQLNSSNLTLVHISDQKQENAKFYQFYFYVTEYTYLPRYVVNAPKMEDKNPVDIKSSKN